MTDRELLRAYAQGDESAFRQIVSSYIDFVHSAARRQVNDPHLAEDVTQLTFLILARKAASLPADVVLAGWLFKATRFVARDALKSLRRRQRHERTAARMKETVSADSESWAELAPYIEEGLSRLRRHERDAVLLRYFRGYSMSETGSTLGISEDAAAQRVSRAVKKLRQFMADKGVTVAGSTLVALIATRAVEAAPAHLAASVLSAVTGGAGPLSATVSSLTRAMAWAKLKAAAVLTAVLLGAAGAVAFTLFEEDSGAILAPTARAAWDAKWEGNSIAKGWPVILPGRVTGTPTPADLDGDGDMEIIIPCMHSDVEPMTRPAHPRPRIERLLFAFHHDGRPLEGWPAVIMDRATRIEAGKTQDSPEDWASNPSVIDYDGDGRDEVVILDRFGVVAVEHEQRRAQINRLIPFGDGWCSVPLVDVDRDGKTDVIVGDVNISIDRKLIPEWPRHRKLEGGYAPCIGDADGDGRVEIYHPSYADKGVINAVDPRGYSLPGWPRKVGGRCRFAPVMGDIDGDGRLEILAADEQHHLLAWTHEGKPLAATAAVGDITGVFKSGIDASMASPTLADLDGDGKAEIIVFDRLSRTLRAWRGDGSGVASVEGIIARLPDAECWGGVSAADLGADGIMDLFVAHYWIKLDRSGRSTVTNMLPEHAMTTAQPTVMDLNGDDQADVLFGLADGRVFVYETHLPYRTSALLWLTANGNVRRTGKATAP